METPLDDVINIQSWRHDGASRAQVLPQMQAVDEVKHLSEAKPSFARVRYSEQCEAAINEQINVEYTISVRA